MTTVGLRPAVAGLALAFPATVFAFRASRPNFWMRMLVVSGSLGAYALAVDAKLRDVKPDIDDAIAGTISAALLYGSVRTAEAWPRSWLLGFPGISTRSTAGVAHAAPRDRRVPCWRDRAGRRNCSGAGLCRVLLCAGWEQGVAWQLQSPAMPRRRRRREI